MLSRYIKLILTLTSYLIFVSLLAPPPAYAMHIMEGFLPLGWAAFWFLLVLPFWAWGLKSLKVKVSGQPSLKLLLGLAGAFTFVLSALKLPSVTGSCSHPTGVGLGAILFGPAAMSVLGAIVLLFQALLLAHGGLTTLGANTFSMAVVGPLVSYGIYKFLQKARVPLSINIFLAAALGDLATYAVTSLQLALAFPAPDTGIWGSFVKFIGIFAVTQIPLAISEGLLTVVVFNYLFAYNKEELKELAVLREEGN
ncbi:cobalt/nickel transport system permease protein [Thermanaeromonas toyohensis ToBE]|uniref:Cobalt transport protein CbiM n=1 Tax=Thermanaeromonas toyohensis ToBE TaxID=698762 RepID=A0A1W1VY09_9FIRM|nr:energy-coupling factor ABC transporter permease [Thermanaeromonas toyohensis]SMB98272.1 cobalt/nickel transport system permease protein [Thermanaeromonas toyohensis ToBE]